MLPPCGQRLEVNSLKTGQRPVVTAPDSDLNFQLLSLGKPLSVHEQKSVILEGNMFA